MVGENRAPIGQSLLLRPEVMYFHNYVVRIDALSVLAYVSVLALHIIAVQRNHTVLHFWSWDISNCNHSVSYYWFGASLADWHFICLFNKLGYGDKKNEFWVSNGAFSYFAGALIAGLAYLAIFVLPNPTEFFLIPNVKWILYIHRV